jgi:hypothetical protein
MLIQPKANNTENIISPYGLKMIERITLAIHNKNPVIYKNELNDFYPLIFATKEYYASP